MPNLNLTADAVRQAMADFDAAGRDQFLAMHGFRRARQYFLLDGDRYYDSKAIAGVAYGHARHGRGPLSDKEFSGGEATVATALRGLGFTVLRVESPEALADTPIVLVQNEVTYAGRYDYWEDETGVRYHFPNHYRTKIRPGRRFVYYRGVRRADGSRGIAEYFGNGVIGGVWRDTAVPEKEPKAHWRWYCTSEEYVEFPERVPARIGGVSFEPITTTLGWRTGVRDLTEDAYHQILSRAGLRGRTPDAARSVDARPRPLKVPPITEVVPTDVEDALALLAPAREGVHAGTAARGGRSRATETKVVGDRAEEIVYRRLERQLAGRQRASLRWPAREQIGRA